MTQPLQTEMDTLSAMDVDRRAISDENAARLDVETLDSKSVAPLLKLNFWLPEFAPHLLSSIVSASPTLNPQYIDTEKAANLLEDTSLVRQLEEVWNIKSFAKIRSWG